MHERTAALRRLVAAHNLPLPRIAELTDRSVSTVWKWHSDATVIPYDTLVLLALILEYPATLREIKQVLA